jgi:PKD repeat protein
VLETDCMKITFTFLILVFIVNVKSLAQCNAAFTYTTEKDKVNFIAVDSSVNKSSYWNFGDGNAASSNGLYHLLNIYNPGSYTVKHIIIDSINNCTDSSIQIISVNYDITCKASFVTDSHFFSGNEITFSSYPSSTIGSGYINEYSWTVDGLKVSNNLYLIDTFSTGIHELCLRIATSNGCNDTKCDTIQISPPKKCNSQKSFSATASSLNGKEVYFSVAPALPALNYKWDFGDGHYFSDSSNLTYIYLKSGTYPVTLYAFDSLVRFCIDTIKQNVVIANSPADSCTASFTYTFYNQQATFTPVSNQAIVHVDWDIQPLGDSTYFTSSAIHPVYIFADTSHYNVCFTIKTITGCSVDYCQVVAIDSVSSHRQSNSIQSVPNPATSFVKMNIEMAAASEIIYTIYNEIGIPVYKKQTSGLRGTNTITINLQTLKKGQYFIDIKYGNHRKQSVFQKL